MDSKFRTRLALCLTILSVMGLCGWQTLRSPLGVVPLAAAEAAPPSESLEQRFTTRVQPLLERYCFSCHGAKKQEASLDLSRDSSIAAVAKNAQQWQLVLERLQAEEMPPEDARRRPEPAERAAVIAWIRDLCDQEAARNAGDPGIVLARRLSNAEYDNTIRDLTGVNIRPTREFPVDPANQSGFDNSGESLAMSAALLKKYLAAARLVAEHVLLKPEGFVFAPHPVVTDTDRDKYCVQRIINFYQRHPVDYADYFMAAWRYRHRDRLGRPDAELSRFATEAGLSAKYLEMVWSVLHAADEETGPVAALQKRWNGLPAPSEGSAGRATQNTVRLRCEQLRDLIVRMRGQLKPNVEKLYVKGMSDGNKRFGGSQPFVIWYNRELASRHRSYCGEVFPDLAKLCEQIKDLTLAKLCMPETTDAETEEKLRKSLERFCSVFPVTFVVSDRGMHYNPNEPGSRPLTAGFQVQQGYFRDDEPLCELILDERGRLELDAMWDELNFITLVPMRQYKDFIYFERANSRFIADTEFDFARSEDKDITSEAKMSRLGQLFLAKAQKNGASDEASKAIETYFAEMSAEIRRLERARPAAEPSHLQALVTFTQRAYRRPLAAAEREDLLAFYRTLREQDNLGHEEALRDTLAAVLLSPHFSYRFDLAQPGTTARPLSDYELASRLSYFLWSSMPDAELLAHAAAGDLHKPDVLTGQARRLLRDPKVRGLATEFGGNWLDFRRFEEHNSVDRDRFPSFTNELRQAMFEEPVRYLVAMAQRNRSVLDLLYAKDTFVNRPLAEHYGMPEPGTSGKPAAPATGARADGWFHVADADRYGRGGLLPMAVFLTKNAPGLRTSPVKRGYWVVRRLLGEQIPPPPASVPELPMDEANLGELTLPQVLARHRDDKACAGCHKRFDSVGLVFEDFGPIGERRTKDLGGKLVQTAANFPDGKDRDGLAGLRDYLRHQRQDDFVDNLCRKLYSYALGRGLMLSDKKALDEMRARLAADKYAFGSLVESIVTSPQFLNKRGRENSKE